MALASLTAPATHEARTAVLPVAVVGLGAYLPERVVTNADLAEVLDTSDEWIRTRTGIGERRAAAAGQATSDLALEAARAALVDAGLVAGDLGAIVVSTCTPDHLLPGVAPLLAAALGVEVLAFDLNAACSGFVYGLRVAGALAATGTGPVLLVGAETLTRIVDPTDRGTAILFGDGAGAVVLAADDDASLGPFDLGSDGSDPSILWAQATGTRHPIDPARLAAGEQYLTMRGSDVYRHAVRRMTASSLAVLADAGLTVDDVDLFVGHQANARILDAVAQRLGIDPAVVPPQRRAARQHLGGVDPARAGRRARHRAAPRRRPGPAVRVRCGPHLGLDAPVLATRHAGGGPMSDTVALVTGGSGGIGAAICRGLAADGFTVLVGYGSSPDAAAEVAASCAGKAEAVHVDVTDPDSVAAAVARAGDLGTLGVLVNNAGVALDDLLLRLDAAALDRTLDVNLKGAFHASKAAIRPMLRARGGRIVNVTSIVGLVGNAGQTAYAASKAGLVGLTKSLAREVARKGITVNAVAPGYVETAMTAGLDEDAQAAIRDLAPIGRAVTPDEVAAAVRFLASPAAGAITGVVLPVDGGAAM